MEMNNNKNICPVAQLHLVCQYSLWHTQIFPKFCTQTASSIGAELLRIIG